MIKNSTPLTLAEVASLAGEGEKSEKVKTFIKKFTKIDIKKSKEIKEKLKKLDLIKLKADSLVKIVDFMPEDSVDLIKILPDISLDQDEINKILGVIKEY